MLNTALKDAVRWGYLNKNPAENVLPPRSSKIEWPVVSPEDQGTLAWILESEAKPESLLFRRNGALAVSANMLLFHLVLLTGMRRGEMAGLQFADVDEDSRVIHVRRSVSESDRQVFLKPPKSARGLRQIDVDDHLLCLIATLWGHSGIMRAGCLRPLRVQF